MNFGNISFRTESVKYMGSKQKLLPIIFETINNLKVHSILDGFSGSTRVSQTFAKRGYQVHANDISELSFCLNKCFLLNKKDPSEYTDLIQEANNLKPVQGWFAENYGGSEKKTGKFPFTEINMAKTDAILEFIKKLGYQEKNLVLTSLILALNKVDNTQGHFSSYFRNYSEKSLRPLFLKVPDLWINKKDNFVYKQDIKSLIKNVGCDVAYFDPPYGSNQEKALSSRTRYNAYYHFWKTLILNDQPKLFGKAKRREDSRDLNDQNPYEDYHVDQGVFIAEKEIKFLIEQTPQKYVLFSYSNEGRVPIENLEKIFRDNSDRLEIIIIDHRHHVLKQMGNSVRENSLQEYLFLLKR